MVELESKLLFPDSQTTACQFLCYLIVFKYLHDFKLNKMYANITQVAILNKYSLSQLYTWRNPKEM